MDDQLRLHVVIDQEGEEDSRLKARDIVRLQIEFCIAKVFERNFIRERRMLNREQVFFSKADISFMILMDDLKLPEQCQFTLSLLIFTLNSGERARFELEYTMPFLEIMNDSIKEAYYFGKGTANGSAPMVGPPPNSDSPSSSPQASQIDEILTGNNSSEESGEPRTNIKFTPLKPELGTFIARDAPEQFHDKIKKELNGLDNHVEGDAKFLMKECLLKCVFSSLSCLINLRSLSSVEVWTIMRKLINQYFREYTGSNTTSKEEDK